MIKAPSSPRLAAITGSAVLKGRRLAWWGLTACVVLLGLGGLSEPGFGAPSAELERIATQYYDVEFRSRAAEFHRAREIAFFVQVALLLAVVWWLGLGPLSRWNAWSLRLAGGHPWLARVIVLTALTLIIMAVRLPFSLFRYVHSTQYGLRTDSWGQFLLDWLKAAGVGWMLVVVVGVLVLGLFAAFPRWWWAVSMVGISLLAVGYITVAPVFIDPLFNEFRKLEDAELEGRILEICRRGGVETDEVLVADASRRSRTANAYFTGLGKTRRIVLYDNLVEKFSADEVIIVVAHEAGHWRRNHIRLGLALGLGATLVGLLIGHFVAGRWVAGGLGGLAGRGDPALALPAYALYVTLMLVALVPSNWVSRRMETEADREALTLTRDPETFIRTETRLAHENLSDVLPPEWIEFTLYTHPSNVRRIRLAEEFR
jgi:STE24 endopeptidase